LKHLTTMRRPQLTRRDPWQRVARPLLLLMLLLIAISPITQSIWKSDNFLHGQDTETTLAIGLTLASISLLRMQRGRLDLDEMLRRVRTFLSSIFGAWLLGRLTKLDFYRFSSISTPQRAGRRGKYSGFQPPLLI
jgi:hypothetical protein